MNQLSDFFGKAYDVTFTIPKLLPSGDKQQTSIIFKFQNKIDADRCLIGLHKNYKSGQLSLNIYQTNELIELSFIDNQTIDEIYVGKFKLNDTFESFKSHVSNEPYMFLFISFFDGDRELLAFISSDPKSAHFVLAGFNCI